MKYTIRPTVCKRCFFEYYGIVCNICKTPSDFWKSVKERK